MDNLNVKSKKDQEPKPKMKKSGSSDSLDTKAKIKDEDTRNANNKHEKVKKSVLKVEEGKDSKNERSKVEENIKNEGKSVKPKTEIKQKHKKYPSESIENKKTSSSTESLGGKESNARLLVDLFGCIQKDVHAIKEFLEQGSSLRIKSMSAKKDNKNNEKSQSESKISEIFNSSSSTVTTNETFPDEENFYFEKIKGKYRVGTPFSATNSRNILDASRPRRPINKWLAMLDSMCEKNLLQYVDENKGIKRYKRLE